MSNDTETMPCDPIVAPTKDTIITIQFTEDNSQEDATYKVTEIEEKLAEQASLEESPTKEEDESEEEGESCEDLKIEQVPIGVTEVTSERNNKITTCNMLVFNNSDEPVQTLNEVSFESEDEEEDKSFEPEKDSENNEEETQSDTESVDQDDLKDIQVVENGDDCKLKFTDVEECRLKLQEEALSTEEITVEEDTQDYDEEADNDFNPTYCDQTLSDVEEPEDCPEEQPETIELEDGDACMIKPDPTTKIPLMETESCEGMEDNTCEEEISEKESQEDKSMDCE